jgi:hypothetical protein
MRENFREHLDDLLRDGYSVRHDEHLSDSDLIDPGGNQVETWREDYPYDERLDKISARTGRSCREPHHGLALHLAAVTDQLDAPDDSRRTNNGAARRIDPGCARIRIGRSERICRVCPGRPDWTALGRTRRVDDTSHLALGLALSWLLLLSRRTESRLAGVARGRLWPDLARTGPPWRPYERSHRARQPGCCA